MNIYGVLNRFEVSTHRAKIWEAKMPFKKYSLEPRKQFYMSKLNIILDFVTADGSAGLPTFVRTAPPQQNSSSSRSSQSSTQQPS